MGFGLRRGLGSAPVSAPLRYGWPVLCSSLRLGYGTTSEHDASLPASNFVTTLYVSA